MKDSLFLLEDGQLRPSWRFLLSVLVAWFATQLAAAIALLAFGTNASLRRVVYCPLWMGLLMLGFAWLLTTFDGVRHHRLAAMGLPGGRRALRHSLLGALTGVGMVVVTIGLMAIGTSISLTVQVRLQHDLPKFLVEVFVVLSTAAMAEELMFRGYPFQRLVEATGAGGAVAVAAALFGMAHLRNPHASTVGFINTILIGILFAVAYLRSGSLWLPWGMHWAWNTVLATVGLPVSGNDMSVGVHTAVEGPKWLTGGAYGPEASLAATVAVVVGLAVIVLGFRKVHTEPANSIPSV